MTAPDFPYIQRMGESEIDFPDPQLLHIGMKTQGTTWLITPTPNSIQSMFSSELRSSVEWIGVVEDLYPNGIALVRYPSGRSDLIPVNYLALFMPDAADGEWAEEPFDDEDAMSIDSTAGEVVQIPDQWNTHEEVPPSISIEAPDPEEQLILKTNQPFPSAKEMKIFEIADICPFDHHYHQQPQHPPSKSFMNRIYKEYKVMGDSLPEHIWVQAYAGKLSYIFMLP